MLRRAFVRLKGGTAELVDGHLTGLKEDADADQGLGSHG